MPTYTYDDFTRAADAAGLTGSFDASDLTTAQKFPEYGLSLVSLKRDLGNAQTAEQRLLATEAMNQLRKNYGSYGVGEGSNRSYATSFGSRINQQMEDIGNYAPYSSAYGDQISKALEDIGNYGDFTYSQDSAYKDVLDKIINQQSFSYDPSTDPIFSSYKKAYNREGDRAAANALAAAASATGGRASSYANMAAQQANNYYAGKLADVIPTLRSQALTEYNNQYDQLLRQMNAMASDRGNEYQQYLDRLTQMQQQLQALQGQDATEYGRYTDQLGQMQQDLENLRAQDATDYSRYLDELNAAYQRERDEAADKQNDFDNSLKVFQATGQITGPLADYLGGGSTYAAAAATYTGGSGGYGGGGYGGSRSGNAPTAQDAAAQAEIEDILTRWGTSQITGQPYTDASGSSFANVGSWEEYQRLKELTGATDAALNQAGIRYGYPTTTDASGNLTPAIAYTPVGGSPQTWEQVDAAGGNYQAMSQRLEQMKAAGVSKEDVLADIRAFYQAGQITSSDYQRLYNRYRNMNASEFGTTATTPSTSGRATGAGTVKPGTRTPGAATATTSTPAATTPTYDSRGIPWAYSPDNPANKSTTPTATTPSTSGRATGAGTVKPGTRTPGGTTSTAASGNSSNGNLLTTLGNALKQAVQQANAAAAANPYAGYVTDPVTSANATAKPKVDAVTSAAPTVSKSSTASSGSSATKKSTGTVSAGTRTPGGTTSTAARSSSNKSTSSGSSTNALTQLGNALKNAVTNAVKSVTGGTSKSTSSSSSKSTSHRSGKF